MFDNGRFAQAALAFRKAGRDKEVKICDAYILQEKAGLISTVAAAARKKAFVDAANAFSTCAQNSPPRQTKERLTCYETAGDCYSEARDLKSAGDSYRLAELYAEAACTYREGEFFDEMVKVITLHKRSFTSELYQELMMAARMHYFKVYSSCWLFLSISDPL